MARTYVIVVITVNLGFLISVNWRHVKCWLIEIIMTAGSERENYTKNVYLRIAEKGDFKSMMKPFLALLLGMMLLVPTGDGEQRNSAAFYGSFTAEKTYSYDGQYYALQTVENNQKAGTLGAGEIKVTVYLAGTDEPISSFVPARALDFWGICWEKDSYVIWTQSADIGIYGYEYRDGQWVLDEGLTQPEYIISRWDDEYRAHPELWDTIWHSPTDPDTPIN